MADYENHTVKRDGRRNVGVDPASSAFAAKPPPVAQPEVVAKACGNARPRILAKKLTKAENAVTILMTLHSCRSQRGRSFSGSAASPYDTASFFRPARCPGTAYKPQE